MNSITTASNQLSSISTDIAGCGAPCESAGRQIAAPLSSSSPPDGRGGAGGGYTNPSVASSATSASSERQNPTHHGSNSIVANDTSGSGGGVLQTGSSLPPWKQRQIYTQNTSVSGSSDDRNISGNSDRISGRRSNNPRSRGAVDIGGSANSGFGRGDRDLDWDFLGARRGGSNPDTPQVSSSAQVAGGSSDCDHNNVSHSGGGSSVSNHSYSPTVSPGTPQCTITHYSGGGRGVSQISSQGGGAAAYCNNNQQMYSQKMNRSGGSDGSNGNTHPQPPQSPHLPHDGTMYRNGGFGGTKRGSCNFSVSPKSSPRDYQMNNISGNGAQMRSGSSGNTDEPPWRRTRKANDGGCGGTAVGGGNVGVHPSNSITNDGMHSIPQPPPPGQTGSYQQHHQHISAPPPTSGPPHHQVYGAGSQGGGYNQHLQQRGEWNSPQHQSYHRGDNNTSNNTMNNTGTNSRPSPYSSAPSGYGGAVTGAQAGGGYYTGNHHQSYSSSGVLYRGGIDRAGSRSGAISAGLMGAGPGGGNSNASSGTINGPSGSSGGSRQQRNSGAAPVGVGSSPSLGPSGPSTGGNFAAGRGSSGGSSMGQLGGTQQYASYRSGGIGNDSRRWQLGGDGGGQRWQSGSGGCRMNTAMGGGCGVIDSSNCGPVTGENVTQSGHQYINPRSSSAGVDRGLLNPTGGNQSVRVSNAGGGLGLGRSSLPFAASNAKVGATGSSAVSGMADDVGVGSYASGNAYTNRMNLANSSCGSSQSPSLTSKSSPRGDTGALGAVDSSINHISGIGSTKTNCTVGQGTSGLVIQPESSSVDCDADEDDGWGDDDGFGGDVSMVDITQIKKKEERNEVSLSSAMAELSVCDGQDAKTLKPGSSDVTSIDSSPAVSTPGSSSSPLNGDGDDRKENASGESTTTSTLSDVKAKNIKDPDNICEGSGMDSSLSSTSACKDASGGGDQSLSEVESTKVDESVSNNTVERKEDGEIKIASENCDETRSEEDKKAGSSTPTSVSEKKVSIWRPRSALQGGSKEEVLERTIKSLLNKLTIEKFPTITEKMSREMDNLTDERLLQGIVNQVLEKAVLEPEWSEMYADMCQVLKWRSPTNLSPSPVSSAKSAGSTTTALSQSTSQTAPSSPPPTQNQTTQTPFSRFFLIKIGEQLEAMPRTIELTPQQLEQLDSNEQQIALKKVKNRIRGLVKLVGELFQRKMVTFKTVMMVATELVMSSAAPDEHFVECFLQLIDTTGYYIDQNPNCKSVLDTWFGRLSELKGKKIYSQRLKCVIQDTLDLRKAQWHRKIHRERAKALSDLQKQAETEEVIGGAIHAAQYGNIVLVGERSNMASNGAYAEYMRAQEQLFSQKLAASGPSSTPTMQNSSSSSVPPCSNLSSCRHV